MPAAVDAALKERFRAEPEAARRDPIPGYRIAAGRLPEALAYLKHEAEPRFEMLYDLSAIDESERGEGYDGYTVFYHLLSLSGNADLRLTLHLDDDRSTVPSATPVWPAANWYEREVYDMFGLRFDGHPDLRRILLPEYWEGHPLRKSHPSRATEMEPYTLTPERYQRMMETYQADESLVPADSEDEIVLNIGPHHTGTHGILRLIARLKGEEIRFLSPDIGYHHRGAEKIAERHTFHNYIPYTDRIDYLSGVLGELPYVMAVEQLADIDVPPRAKIIRIMLCEMFRISNHLVWLGSVGPDLGAMGPAFYCFRDREHLFDAVELITGGRMHPEFFRIGGVALDLPDGWKEAVLSGLDRIERAMPEYETLTIKSGIFRSRTRGIGRITLEEAIEWGFTGPNLRACGIAWDLRKTRPYGGYDRFDFEVPTSTDGDCLARICLRVEEIRQSISIVRQAAEQMPEGPILSDQARYAFPRKEETLQHIETLIHHFVGESRGMSFPPGESFFCTEASKGMLGYQLVSNGSSHPYRVRIRTPSFPHVQAVPRLAEGHLLSDLIAILASLDYVLADLDR
jgi:NADH dehydrogenase I D subunit